MNLTMPLDASLDERVAWLRQAGAWSALSEPVLRDVAAAMRPAAYAAGEFMIRQGEPGRYLHVLARGEADVRVRAANGTTVSVATMSAGACFGEMSLLSGDVTSADVIAASDCETFLLERPAFEALVAEQPQLLREFVRMVSGRLRHSNAAMGAAREKERQLTRFLQEARNGGGDSVVGGLPGTRALQQRIEAEAPLDRPVLVQGEPGTGKELVARLLHFRGPRRDAPLLCTDCAQIAETPWGDKLFGEYRRTADAQGLPPALSYLDLARGGTIVLKNIDSLPRAIQERLALFLQQANSEEAPASSGVRIVATCRDRFQDLAAAGRVSPALAAVLAEHVLEIPPLRERKRDIRALAAYFVRKHAERLGKSVPELDDRSLARLVTHDFRHANVRELEEVLQRAVILTDGNRIEPEAIFLGQPPAPSRWAFNLLSLPRPIVRRALALFPHGVQAIVLAGFAVTLYACFFVPAGPAGKIGTALVWSVGWPLLVLSFFFAGRACCAVCPMPPLAAAAQRLVGRDRSIPGWLKRHDGTIVMAGFFAIIWAEEATRMRHDPRATGLLLSSIGLGAVLTAMLLPRRTWCRHLCPMGAFAGVGATTAVVELRPTPDICSAKCRDHACFKGDGHVAGCPLFNHVMFVDSNRHCVLCMKCVRSCQHESPQLNLRLPASELATAGGDRAAAGRFAALLGGLVASLVLIQRWEGQAGGVMHDLLRDHHLATVTWLLALGGLAPQAALWAAVRRLRSSSDAAATDRFWQRVAAWTPIVTAAFTCYQLAFVPVLDAVRITLGTANGGAGWNLSFGLLQAVQAGLLLSGLLVTLGILWALRRTQRAPAAQR